MAPLRMSGVSRMKIATIEIAVEAPVLKYDKAQMHVKQKMSQKPCYETAGVCVSQGFFLGDRDPRLHDWDLTYWLITSNAIEDKSSGRFHW